MTLSRNKKRTIAAILVVMMTCAMMTTVAFARHYDDLVWLQLGRSYWDDKGVFHHCTTPKYLELGELSPGSNINTSGITFYGVATSAAPGTFAVRLQRQGAFWVWSDVPGSTARTVLQNSDLHTDPRNNTKVHGQPFSCTWSTNQSGKYRIVLEDATAPQELTLSSLEAWAYGSN